jgi:hypothetical protein
MGDFLEEYWPESEDDLHLVLRDKNYMENAHRKN